MNNFSAPDFIDPTLAVLRTEKGGDNVNGVRVDGELKNVSMAD